MRSRCCSRVKYSKDLIYNIYNKNKVTMGGFSVIIKRSKIREYSTTYGQTPREPHRKHTECHIQKHTKITYKYVKYNAESTGSISSITSNPREQTKFQRPKYGCHMTDSTSTERNPINRETVRDTVDLYT